MKKFTFTLQPLQKVKKNQEKLGKQKLADAEGMVLAAFTRLNSLKKSFKEQSEIYQERLLLGADALSMKQFSEYFVSLQKETEIAQLELDEAKAFRKKCQEELVEIMKELKMLDNLYQAQYGEYLAEVKKEEEKNIGDLVSFRVVATQERGKSDD